MRDPDAADLLEVWERGRGATPVVRALLLLGAAEPASSADDLAGLSIGERDARLLRLRARLFGSTLECTAACPECSELLELTLTTHELLAAHTSHATTSHWLERDGVRVRYRLPTSADLLALAGITDAHQARASLLARCVETPGDTPVPGSVAELVIAEMAAADPLADAELSLTCPSCAASWTTPFDVVGFLWSEVDAWALRMLGDVHVLARAYGWSESAILALSAPRRRAYLDLVRAGSITW